MPPARSSPAVFPSPASLSPPLWAAFTPFSVCSFPGNALFSLAIDFAVGLLLCFLAFGFRSPRRFLASGVLFFGVSLLTGGAVTALYGFLTAHGLSAGASSGGSVLLPTAFLTACGALLLAKIFRRETSRRFLSLKLSLPGAEGVFEGLVDSRTACAGAAQRSSCGDPFGDAPWRAFFRPLSPTPCAASAPSQAGRSGKHPVKRPKERGEAVRTVLFFPKNIFPCSGFFPSGPYAEAVCFPRFSARYGTDTGDGRRSASPLIPGRSKRGLTPGRTVFFPPVLLRAGALCGGGGAVIPGGGEAEPQSRKTVIPHAAGEIKSLQNNYIHIHTRKRAIQEEVRIS